MSERTPTVSVIIPTYNRAHLVSRAIQSVLNQTYQDFEIIVVDDTSADNTEEVIKSFNDPRIRYMRHEQNRGGSAARNTGIKATKGEYIAFLDSDDEWLPEKLGRQLQVFAESATQVGLVYTGETVIDSGMGRVLNKKAATLTGDVHDRLLKGDFIGTCSSVMVKKTAIEEVDGFDEQLVSRQDWDCWLLITQHHSVACVPESLIIRYTGQQAISSELRRIAKGTRVVIAKHQKDFERSPKTYGRALASLAQMELTFDRKCGWKTAWKAVTVYPLQLKVYIALLLSLAGQGTYAKLYSWWKRMRGDQYLGRALS